MKYSEVKKLVRKKSQVKLNEFKYTVSYIHIDGTQCEFVGSFIEQFDEWVAIYTEHHGYFIYHLTDLMSLDYLDDGTNPAVDFRHLIDYYDNIAIEALHLINVRIV